MANETITVDEFLALNDQLAALVDAGVPIDVGLVASDTGSHRELDTINATVRRRVRRGESLTEALEGDEGDLPDSYRRMMQLGIRARSFDSTLSGARRLAELMVASRHEVTTALLYPLVVCGLAFAGLIGFCLFFVPTLERMYESLRATPGVGLGTLHWLRTTLPYWVAVPPVLVLLVIAWRFRTKPAGAHPAWLPGVSQAIFQQRCANFAEALAALLEQKVPLDESLRLAGGACGDATLREGAEALAKSIADGQLPSAESPLVLPFPPFLRWALWHLVATTGRERALRMAARIYREAAERRNEQSRVVAPLVTLVVLGGGATLAYGLALFAPVVELLRALAR
jgi:general secretion pathway protein F